MRRTVRQIIKRHFIEPGFRRSEGVRHSLHDAGKNIQQSGITSNYIFIYLSKNYLREYIKKSKKLYEKLVHRT